ncbi:treble-clef zinc-finger protein [Murinocardiopsis flavida]|uniref:Treble-clef zinc-finger protein n=1 Tax=Murinocardiopsis flavida TaxID=645275 RepID=A0A2P8DGY3_9ACTN|nr:FBP domain-containing protein [Murinocardiopsis flavida]PSK96466.1 treble-clef zinc-finger protein [Murinocardiopsis flavida]
MNPISEKEIRASFVNCSKGAANRLGLPRHFADLPWPDLDFLGWRDPGAPERGHIVAEHGGGLVGVALRVPPPVRGGLTRTTVCSICLTGHSGSGVSLLTASRAGAAGRDGNSVGVYMCDDLACPLYVRGLRTPTRLGRYEESLTVEEKLDRALANLGRFLDTVLDGGPA